MLDVDHGTYPFVTSSSATAGGAATGVRRRAEPPRPDHRHRQGVHDARRLGPVPDRAVRRVGRVAALARLRVRHHDRPSAPRRLVRRPDHPLRDAHQRHHRLRAHQARHPHRARRDPGLRRLRRRRRAVRRGAGQPVRLPPRDADLRGLPRLEGGHLRRPRRSTTCRSNAQDYVLALEGMSGTRISVIGVGAGARRGHRAPRPRRLMARSGVGGYTADARTANATGIGDRCCAGRAPDRRPRRRSAALRAASGGRPPTRRRG